MHSANHRSSGQFPVQPRNISPTIFVNPGSKAVSRESGNQPRRISPSGASGAFTITWGPAPEVFPAGARMAVLHGNPKNAEPFIAFLRFPDGYVLDPHTHSIDEHVTVITGTLEMGMGTTCDAARTVMLRAGDSMTAYAGQPHYATAHGVTIVQINAVGPLDLSYVTPCEAPVAAAR
jgi:mannose-6-phosphate isomerase-like protein (cupin superfamily)